MSAASSISLSFDVAHEREASYEENGDDTRGDSNKAIACILEYFPMFMVSIAMHAVVLLILALIPNQAPEKQDDVIVITDYEEVEELVELEKIVLEPTEIEVDTDVTEEDTEVEEEEEVEVEEEVEEEEDDSEILEELSNDLSDALNDAPLAAIGIGVGGLGMPSGGGILGGRGNKGFRKRSAGALNTKIIDCALKWLASQQGNEGRWKGSHPNAVSSAAVLAFLGNGNSTSIGEYKEVVQKYVDFYCENQRADGSYGNHGHATPFVVMAMCDAFALESSNQKIKTFCEKAVDYTLKTQNIDGGWNGGGKSAALDKHAVDIAQSSWYAMALFSAKLAGLNVPNEAVRKINTLFRSIARGTYKGELLCTSHGGVEDEFLREFAAQSYVSTVLQFTGARSNDPDVVKSSKYILDNLSSPDNQNYWLLYNQGLGIFQLGKSSPLWKKFKSSTLSRIGKGAIAENGMLHWENHKKFSKAGGKKSDTNAQTNYWGDVGATGMAVLNLQVFYRYGSLEEML